MGCGDEGYRDPRLGEVLIAGLGASFAATGVLLPWFLFGAAPRCKACGRPHTTRWRSGPVECAACGTVQTMHARLAYFAILFAGVTAALFIAGFAYSARVIDRDEEFIFSAWALGALTTVVMAWLFDRLRRTPDNLPRAVQLPRDAGR